MNEINKLTGRDYQLFNYYGSKNAKHVIVAMGSVTDTIKEVIDAFVDCVIVYPDYFEWHLNIHKLQQETKIEGDLRKAKVERKRTSFKFLKSKSGILRLDTKTGQVVLIKKQNEEIALKHYNARVEEVKKLEDYVQRNIARASTSKMAKSKQKALEKINMQIDGYYDLLAEYRINPTQKREYDRMRERANKKIAERDNIENELKICKEKLSADPKLALNNPTVKDLMHQKKFTELTKEIMDAFVSTILVYEEIKTNPETNKEESNLKVKVGFKFEKL